MKSFKLLLGMLATLVLVLAGCGNGDSGSDASAEDDYPSENLEWTVAFGPGGGNDLMSRTVVEIVQNENIYPENITVENREGGSGASGWSYFKQQEGDPYHLTATSGNMIATPLSADTDWTYADFTPVGLLAADELLIVVDGDSDYETIDDFVEAAASEELNVGSTGTVGPGRVVTGLLEKTADIEVTYVPFQESGQVTTSLLSGSLDALVANPSEILGQLSSGDLRALAYSGEDRNPELEDVPTFQEAGYDFTFSLPRGVMLPGNVSDEVRDWWVDALQQVTETEEWDNYIQENNLTENLIWGEEYGEYLDETNEVFRSTLEDIGAVE